jgi:hypothetical protein
MADHYYSNMTEMYSQGEYRKASELLWGALTQSIKALASLYSIKIYSHKFFKIFIKRISREIGDIEYYHLFLFLGRLHENFYDEKIDPEDSRIYIEKATIFLDKTKVLISKRLKELKNK